MDQISHDKALKDGSKGLKWNCSNFLIKIHRFPLPHPSLSFRNRDWKDCIQYQSRKINIRVTGTTSNAVVEIRRWGKKQTWQCISILSPLLLFSYVLLTIHTRNILFYDGKWVERWEDEWRVKWINKTRRKECK